MYETPKLERYGTFRELTEGGGNSLIDAFGPNADTTNGIGCKLDPNDPHICTSVGRS